MSKPLKLRLRVLKRASFLEEQQFGLFIGKKGENARAAILEFQNPINDFWHPVEVVDETLVTTKEDDLS